MRRCWLVLAILTACGTPVQRAEVVPTSATVEDAEPNGGLDLSRALEPLRIECANDPRPLAEREEEARALWETALVHADADRYQEMLAAFVDVYCLMDGAERRDRVLYTLGVVLEGIGRYRAAYEAFGRFIESGEVNRDVLFGARIRYLRIALRSAVERLERGEEEPFVPCPPGASACAEGETCERDYARFNDRMCEREASVLDEACSGICVPDRLTRGDP